MKNFYKILYVATILLVASCAKDAFWNQDTVVEKGLITGQLLSDEDGSPLKGIKILFERQTKANGGQTFVDTVATNEEGKFEYAIPFPNKVHVSIRDTGRYAKDETFVEVLEKKDYAVNLLSHPTYGVTTVEATLVNEDEAPLAGLKVALSVRESVDEAYSQVETLLTDEQGKVVFENVAFPVYYKVTLDEPENLYAKVEQEGRATKKQQIDVALQTVKKFAEGDFLVGLKSFYTSKAIKNTTLYIQHKSVLETEFSNPTPYSVDEEGHVNLDNLTYPTELKISSGANTAFTFNMVEVSLQKVNIDVPLILEIRETSPQFSTPIYTNLVVEDLNTGSVVLGFPQDVAFDPLTGNTYITDGSNANGNKIVKIDRTGEASVLLGGAGVDDGDLAVAKTTGAWGIVVDKKGDIYFSDNNATKGHRVRKITFNTDGSGTVSTVAGGETSGGDDGIGTAAKFNRPSGLEIDKENKYLYVSEFSGHRVRRIDLATKQVTTIIGSTSGDAEGIGTLAKVNGPGNALVLSPDNSKLFLSGNTSRFGVVDLSTNAFNFFTTNQVGSGYRSRGMDIAPNGDVFIYATGTKRLYKTHVDQPVGTAEMTVLAGNGQTARINGDALSASFNGVLGVMYNPYTNVWYLAEGDASGTKVRVIRPQD